MLGMIEITWRGRIANFQLNRRMMDRKSRRQSLRGFSKKFIAGMTTRNHQMHGQSGFRRAHRPNMQIVDFGNTWNREEMFTQNSDINSARDSLNRKMK